MPKTLLLTLFILTLTLSLKQSEIGRNDWHQENIGQLSFVQLVQNKLFYLTQENILGHLKLDSGQIDSRITLSPNERLLNTNDREVSFLTDNNQVVSYRTQNLQKSVNNKFVTDKILKGIKSYVKSTDGKMAYVSDEKNVRSYSLGSDDQGQGSQQQHILNDVYTAQPNEIIQRVFEFNNKLYVLVLAENEFVVREIANDKVVDNSQVKVDWNAEQVNVHDWQVVEARQIENILVVLFRNKLSLNGFTVLLGKDFSRVQSFQQAYTQIIGSQLLFNSKIYNIQHQKQTQKLTIFFDETLSVEYSLEQHQTTIAILKGNSKYTTIQKQSTNQRISKAFFLQKTMTSFVVVIQYNDLTLVAYSIENGVERLLWTREQGLSAIEKVLFMKYTFSDHLDNEYHRNLLSPAYVEMTIAEKLMKAPMYIALRVKEEISDLAEIVLESLEGLLDVSQLAKVDLKSLAKFRMSEDQQVKLGLKKYIIAVTTNGVIYAIDTKTQKILWKQHIYFITNRKYHESKDRQIVSLMDLRKDYELEAAVLITYSQQDEKLYLQEIKENGDINLLETIPSPILPSIHKLNHESIIINIGDKTINYRLGESHSHEKHFYFYTEEESRIVGWKQVENNVVEIWNFNLDDGERIVATSTAYRGEQSTHIPLVDNGKVIFKNVDYTNLAVLTSKNATSMSLYILNGMTGQVHFNEFRSGLNLNHPVNLAYDQNNVIVTYYNNRNKLYEIWTVEHYQERIQSSAMNMIRDYLEGANYKPSRNRENIIFLSEVYGSPVSIKKLFISESKESLIRRNLFVITRDDKLYMIGRELVSTRRPKQTALFSNEAYPPYQYMLPYDPTKFFSYNLDLHNLRGIEFSASDMQSTIFIMGYGTDIFLIRVAPDQPFDMITEDFNYLVLVAIMIAVTIGVLVLRHKAKKAKLIKPHRD